MTPTSYYLLTSLHFSHVFLRSSLMVIKLFFSIFFFQAEDGIRYGHVTGVQTCALPISIQIFDSWVGALNAADYRFYIKPTMARIFTALQKENVPLILFGIHARHLLLEWNDLPVDVIGLDWRTSIVEARKMGVTKVLQGNLDLTILLGDRDMIETRTKAILDEGMQDGRHVFNLGHGVTPNIKPATLKKLTELIHNYSRR